MEVIFISYELPPFKSGGVYRNVAFLKYLKEFGITPIVVTLSKKSIQTNYPGFVIKDDFGDTILAEHKVYEVDSTLKFNHGNSIFNFLDYYFHPNGREAKYWKDNFFVTIDEVMKKHKPAYIFVTAPPFSIVSLAINASKKYKLPMILDLRDAWSNWVVTPYGSIFHYWYKKRTEKKALENAHKVITTSLQTESDLITSHQSIHPEKFRYIPNGFETITGVWNTENKSGSGKIRIGYVGSFYYDPISRDAMMKKWYQKKAHRMLQYVPNLQDWKYRSPYFFFEAVSKLVEKFPEYRNRISIEFVGENPQWLCEMVHEFGFNDIYMHHGSMSHHQCLEFQSKMDGMLITSAKMIDGRDYSIAGKTFEYFQNQKPILAFVCEGAQKDILNQSGMAVIFNPDKAEQSGLELKQFIDGDIKLQPDNNFISQFYRKELTKKLAAIFSE